MSNPQVLQRMRGTHVGLLPTWADSYGYSVGPRSMRSLQALSIRVLEGSS